MSEKISFINKVRISVTSIKEYKKLMKENISKAIIYSILLSLIVGSILGALSFTTISVIQKTMETAISSDEFKFTLDNGVLNFEKSPIKIEEGRTILYIDTNVSLDEVESIRNIIVHKDISCVMLKDGISYRVNGDEYDYKFSELPLISSIDNEVLLKSLDFIGIIKYIVFVAIIIMVFIRFMINTFILSIVGVIVNKINYLKLSYGDIFKICLYATTLPTILSLIFSLGSFSILISGIYLILIINYLRRETTV